MYILELDFVDAIQKCNEYPYKQPTSSLYGHLYTSLRAKQLTLINYSIICSSLGNLVNVS
ncbi:hypothetical protein SAMN04487943_103257 [Gracilibacillus orientalis]|uniref:Uncharacterized protein n=1 Tax=Gracilibacillus orientalis TaxID=334253 RepID=A0A1I4JZ45_9BACI|nr:hypothetical protein SAMN04487943_103257 [Gracilibacillus orientalis]